MAVKKKMPLRWIFAAACLTSSQNQEFMDGVKKTAAKQLVSEPLSSMQRISLSDLSDPDSPHLTISDLSSSIIGSNLYNFSLSELKVVTRNYSASNLVGEGGFGPVYKGFVDDKLRPGLKTQPVAVKVLDLDGGQGHREWLAEIIFLGQLRHPHVVKLIGYCCEQEQRILVYEYMARGNLANHLFRKYCVAMSWSTRMKIAVETAKGLAFLHEQEKPVIYRDFKASNILLDSDFTAKLSDFGLAKDGPAGDETHVSTRVMGTNGYAAPEYIKTGHLTMMSDVYSYGVFLLELLTGRRSIDTKRPSREQCLVDWVKEHRKKLNQIMDPRLEEQYSIEGTKRFITLAIRCLNERPKCRPTMGEVVETLAPLLMLKCDYIVQKPIIYYAARQENNDEETGNRKGRHKISRSRDVYSDTTLYKSPLNAYAMGCLFGGVKH